MNILGYMRIYITKIVRYYKCVVTSKLITQGAPTVTRKEVIPVIQDFNYPTASTPDTESTAEFISSPASFGPSFPSDFPFEDEPRKGKKKGKKGKKARKKAA